MKKPRPGIIFINQHHCLVSHSHCQIKCTERKKVREQFQAREHSSNFRAREDSANIGVSSPEAFSSALGSRLECYPRCPKMLR